MSLQKAVDIIRNMESISYEQREVFSYLANQFDKHLPDSLSMNYYELAAQIERTNSDLWEQFLDIPDIYRYKHSKLAKLQEFAAIKALRELENKSLLDTAGAVTALKEILEKSKLIQESTKKRQQIVLSYIPPSEEERVEVKWIWAQRNCMIA